MRWWDQGNILAIGVNVVDKDLKSLDKLFLPMYVPTYPVEKGFKDKRTYEEYWLEQNQLPRLKEFEYKGPWIMNTTAKDGTKEVMNFENFSSELKREIIEEISIIKFQEFRSKWEKKCKEEGKELKLVSDNNVFDGAFINLLIQKYIPEDYPIPYTASKNESEKSKKLEQNYASFDKTGSMKKGVLAVLLSEELEKQNEKKSKNLHDFFDLPKGEDIKHDHHPVNDAYTIARDAQYIYGIRDGRYTKKRKIVENENQK